MCLTRSGWVNQSPPRLKRRIGVDNKALSRASYNQNVFHFDTKFKITAETESEKGSSSSSSYRIMQDYAFMVKSLTRALSNSDSIRKCHRYTCEGRVG